VSYRDTFILVAADCPAVSGIVPVSKNGSKPMHLIQYELLAQKPYTYTHEQLLFEVHIRHKGIAEDESGTRLAAAREELFQKKHPCLRASMLPKKYGWGVHYDEQGRIALYGMESREYQQFTQSDKVAQLKAMRSSRG
jgi:hypothetical protein